LTNYKITIQYDGTGYKGWQFQPNQKTIQGEIEKALLNLIHTSGYPNIKFEKKVDFEDLYNKKFN